VHDVAVERFPHSFSWAFRIYYKALIPLVLRSSKKICTVSEFSKSEISNIFHVEDDKIFVVSNAVSEFFRKVNAPAPDKPFILAVSSISHQKNFVRLIEAFLKISDGAHKLYIVGNLNRNFVRSDIVSLIDCSEDRKRV